MNRLQEVDHKHNQIRALLEMKKAKALHIQNIENIAWFTGGADACVAAVGAGGIYSLRVTPEKRVVVTDNIEATRIHAEDKLEDFGFEYDESNWWESGGANGDGTISDGDVAEELQRLRMVMTEPEKDRLRALGKDTADAIEEATRAVQPGDTEYKIAARLVAACRERGGFAVVSLIAADERISQFRHPLPTHNTVDKYAMLVVCMRREGLIVSSTRLVHFGALPAELDEKLQVVAGVDAAAMVATKPGRTLGDVFADIQAAYAAHGHADQWQYHHQGGSAGYMPRELVAVPNHPATVKAGQVYAWNPSVVGCKSEDTILLNDDGFEIVSAHSDAFPSVNVEVDGHTVRRPGILVK